MILPKVTIPVKIPDTIMTGEKDSMGRPIHKYQVPFQFQINDAIYIIPEGETTNFANIPRCMWSFFLPSDPDYAAAAGIHDILYAGEIFKRKYNDQVFLSALTTLEVPEFKRNLMYIAVRVGGGFSYKEHTVERIRDIRYKMIGTRETRRPLWE